MRNYNLALVLAVMFGVSTAARAGDFGSYSITPGFVGQNGGLVVSPPQSTDVVELARNTPFNNGLGFNLPLADFASSADLSALRTHLSQQAAETRWKVANGVALAGALDFVRPADGVTSRFGGTMSTFDGRVAAGANYMRQVGNFDLGAAGGFANGAAMGKIEAGISW